MKTTYYEYDRLQRLKRIKDEDGKVLKKIPITTNHRPYESILLYMGFVSWNANELGCPGDRTLTAYNPAEPVVSADLL